ncbi:EpsD family peptidyl-prolyl cis-trans isomerase [Aquabacterium sp. A3]|uniref:EpsD family peptidyl-prolyl cis-trans isomerase n=1 Tax=Aquabacterium sp. A3 TaxID=3132829 RepID=UPI00311A53A4
MSSTSSSQGIRAARLVVLPIVMAAFLAACGDKSESGGEGKATQAAARVNGDEITVHQINQILQRQPNLKPEQADAASQRILEGLIDQQLAVAKAEEQKLDRDPQIVQALDSARRNILARAYLERTSAAVAATPTDEDIRKYYDEKPALFAKRKVYALQEFTVPGTPEQYQPLVQTLQNTKNPQEFADALKASGMKFNANQVTQAAENLPMAIVDQLAKVGDGQALYITAKDGFKAVLVVASREQPIDFEKAKPIIEQFLMTERRREAAQKEIKTLREAAKIDYLGKFAEKAAQPASEASAPAEPSVTEPVTAPASAGGIDADALSKGLSGLK